MRVAHAALWLQHANEDRRARYGDSLLSPLFSGFVPVWAMSSHIARGEPGISRLSPKSRRQAAAAEVRQAVRTGAEQAGAVKDLAQAARVVGGT